MIMLLMHFPRLCYWIQAMAKYYSCILLLFEISAKISYEKKDKKETELIIVIMTNPVFYLIHHKSNPHEKPSNQPPQAKPSSYTLTKTAHQKV